MLRTSISEQVDESGQRVGIVVLVKDVSRLVAMESELRKRDRLAAAGTLAAGVAHEIRNPLSALELNLRLLRDEVATLGTTGRDIEGYFEILFAETRRLNRITSNFLQLSRPEPLARVRVPVHHPVMQVARLVNREAQEKNISLVLDLAGGDPEVLGDSTKLEQVCLNILINAMQAMPTGGVIHVASAHQLVRTGASLLTSPSPTRASAFHRRICLACSTHTSRPVPTERASDLQLRTGS